MGVVLSISIQDCPWRKNVKREKETLLMLFVNPWIQLDLKTYLPYMFPIHPLIHTFLGCFNKFELGHCQNN